LPPTDLPEEIDVPPDELRFHQVKGAGGDDDGSSGERPDEIASHYGNPAGWRLYAAFNKIDDLWKVSAGDVLMIPPGSSVGDKA
jgi:hypothetical protein